MIKVAALTTGRNAPSSRFRVRQHIPALGALGVKVNEYPPLIDKYGSALPASLAANKNFPRPEFVSAAWRYVKLATRAPGLLGSWKSDITWLEREFMPGYFTLEALIKGPLVLDVDDAIWLTPPHGLESIRRLGKRADVVVAGNSYIADWFSSTAKSIIVLPTAVDSDAYIPNPLEPGNSEGIVVGWIGTSGNLPYVYAIESALADFVRARPASKILVVADRKPEFKVLSDAQFQFIKWSVKDEVANIQAMDVGIMPLPDTEWTRGKCGFKMLQYFSCGIPAIASPVGMNRDILAHADIGIAATSLGEWTAALIHLHDEKQIARQMGARGRSVVEQNYSINVVAPALAKVFEQL